MFRDRVLNRLAKGWTVNQLPVVSILQFSQQLCKQLHASAPAHAVYGGGETGYLNFARFMRHKSHRADIDCTAGRSEPISPAGNQLGQTELVQLSCNLRRR